MRAIRGEMALRGRRAEGHDDRILIAFKRCPEMRHGDGLNGHIRANRIGACAGREENGPK
jgi:hypothetical protein